MKVEMVCSTRLRNIQTDHPAATFPQCDVIRSLKVGPTLDIIGPTLISSFSCLDYRNLEINFGQHFRLMQPFPEPSWC
jgi:hypothetical protein